MRRHLPLAAAAALAAACGGTDLPVAALPGIDPGAGEPAALAGITDAHNAVRAAVAGVAPLPPLTWDPGLAAVAAAWAAQCRDQDANGLVDHNPDRSAGSPVYVGENIYASTGTATAQGAVSGWASEAAFYTYATNTCAAGKVCGHYTQLVWRTTTRVGCAKQDCPSLALRSTIVCNYAPGGNSGGLPY
jgi:hypothetical protein